MANQTVIKVSATFKTLLFLMCIVLAFISYAQMGGQSLVDALLQDIRSRKRAIFLILFSVGSVVMFLGFFFDFRKIIVDHNGISSFELWNNRQVFWRDIINVADSPKGVRITTKSEVFYIGHGMRASDRILKAVALHSSGVTSGYRRPVKSDGQIF